jgi:hypothetical protein
MNFISVKNKSVLLFFVIIFYSCQKVEKKALIQDSLLIEYDNDIGAQIDRVNLKFWDSVSAYEYNLSVQGDSICLYSDKGYSIFEDKQKADLIKYYVDLFYISKDIPIVKSKVKNEGFLDVGEYSSLELLIFHDKVLLKESTTIGSDGFKISYHQDFELFLSLINHLIESSS